MKKIIFLITGVLLMASCQHDVIYEVDYNVTLDPQNTYFAGEPVKFNIDGEVDNLLFYSGETGHQYIYKDRYTVAAGDIESVKLEMTYEPQYGLKGGLRVYYTDTFDGLSGNDQAADRQKLSDMSADMFGWVEMPWTEGNSKVEVKHTYDIPLDMYNNLSLAFYWEPVFKDNNAQRTYLVSGNFRLSMKGLSDPIPVSLKNLNFTAVMLNQEYENAYQTDNGKGSILLNGTMKFTTSGAVADVVFRGFDKNHTFGSKGWLIGSLPKMDYVNVDPDKGDVIKNLQNYLHSYEYTWEKPGTYKVTFVGRNENYASASQMVKEYTITILPKPEEN